jgi:ornithine carbamoyltransferase
MVYTDTWTSMGQEQEAEWRRIAFSGYTVDERMMAAAHADAVFMHCLPAHRGEEVTPEVIDGPQSVVVEQAENRLHLQKALMVALAGGTWNRVPRKTRGRKAAVSVAVPTA